MPSLPSLTAIVAFPFLMSLSACSDPQALTSPAEQASSAAGAMTTPIHLTRNPDAQGGERLFAQHCASCHAPQVSPLYPGTYSLARTRGEEYAFLTDRTDLTAEAVIAIVRSGKGAMPNFGQTTIDDEQLAELAVFIADTGS